MMQSRVHSLRFRFAVVSVLWVGVMSVLSGTAISELYRRHVTLAFTSELNNHLDELIALTVTPQGGQPYLDRPLSDPRFQREGSGFYWQVEDPNGTRLVSESLAGRHLIVASGPLHPTTFWSRTGSEQVLRLDRVDRRGLRFSITASGSVLDKEIDEFRVDLALSLAVFAGAMLIGVILQVQYGLRPVRQLTQWIDQLRRGRLERLPSDVPSEFAGIVGRLNELLDAQAILISRARVEAGNLGHNLRTPLALVSAEAEHLEQSGAPVAAQTILDQCHRMQRQIDYHMKRAAAAGARGTGAVSDLRSFVGSIVNAMRRLHAHRDIEIAFEIEPDVHVGCDPGDLSEIVSNLIDNACKWADSTVMVRARRSEAFVEILIEDDGPGIAAEQTLSVMDIGVRLDDTKPGSGLGLPISRDLVLLYGGELVLSNPSARTGLIATVRFPA